MIPAKNLIASAAVILGSTSQAEAQGDPTFLIDQQVGQATGDTCQSYVLAIALAFKRDPQLPLKSWRDMRDLETRIRQEVVKARDARLPNTPANQRLASPDDSAKAVEAVTDGRYTLRAKSFDIAHFGQFIGTTTGVTTEVGLQPSFIVGGLVKDVVISSAKKIDAKAYNSGHQFSIFGVSGPPNSDRKYLVLNSAAYRKPGHSSSIPARMDCPTMPARTFRPFPGETTFNGIRIQTTSAGWSWRRSDPTIKVVPPARPKGQYRFRPPSNKISNGALVMKVSFKKVLGRSQHAGEGDTSRHQIGLKDWHGQKADAAAAIDGMAERQPPVLALQRLLI